MNEEKFHIMLHPEKFPEKEHFPMAEITKHFKYRGSVKPYSLKEIFELMSQGSCIIPSQIDTSRGDLRFMSSKLLMFDIDDDNMVITPENMIKEFKETCAGLYFTPSHLLPGKGYHYRLVFALNDFISGSKDYYKFVASEVMKLIESKGLKLDSISTTPDQRIRSGTYGYIINDLNVRYDINGSLERYESYKKDKAVALASRAEQIMDGNYNFLTFEQLLEMAYFIGNVDDYELWTNLMISVKHYVLTYGHISDSEGYEVFRAISDSDYVSKWETCEPDGRKQIGSFVRHAQDQGYNFRGGKGFKETTHKERVKSSAKYIDLQIAKDIIESEQRVLVKSSTGSGKTFSFINASKECSQKLRSEGHDRFYIFSSPTVALTKQVSTSYDVLGVTGEVEDLKIAISRRVSAGERVFACTYDKTQHLIDELLNLSLWSDYVLIVDEIHHSVHSYSFRHVAIDSLYQASKSAVSFIGLTGTPEEVLKDEFDKMVEIDTGNDRSPCIRWGALTYKKQIEEIPILKHLVKGRVKKGYKLLVYYQNKDVIADLVEWFNCNGVRSCGISSETPDDDANLSCIVKKSAFPPDMDVVISTSVLADGINILNENAKFDCICATSMSSKLYGLDLLKQCSNRFRNTYRDFLLLMQEDKVKEEGYEFLFENAFAHEVTMAEMCVEQINEQFNDDDDYLLYRGSFLEKSYGIIFEKDQEAKYNMFSLRLSASNRKKNHYAYMRESMLLGLKHLIGFEHTSILRIDQADVELGFDMEEILATLEKEKAINDMKKSEQLEIINDLFTEEVYQSFINADEMALRRFKRTIADDHFACLKEVTKFSDYSTSKTVVCAVDKTAKVYRFANRIEAAVSVAYATIVRKKEPNHSIYLEMKKHIGKPMGTEERNQLAKDITKKVKMAKLADVKKIMDLYFKHNDSRTKKARFVTLEILKDEHLAEEFGLSVEDIKRTMAKHTDVKYKDAGARRVKLLEKIGA